MKDVEATFIGYRSRGAEMVLSFAIQRDDLGKTKDLVEMIGHAFRLDIEKIDYDNPQPAQEDQVRHGEPARAELPARAGISDAQAKLYARVGILSDDPGFWNWASWKYPGNASMSREQIGADTIRRVCDVASRKEILLGSRAELAFNLLESAFRASTVR